MDQTKVDDAFTNFMQALEEHKDRDAKDTKTPEAQEEGCECCGCPEQEQCAHEDADEAMANSIYDAEPGSAQLNVVLGILLAFAKAAGYQATATAAFDVWLDTEE